MLVLRFSLVSLTVRGSPESHVPSAIISRVETKSPMSTWTLSSAYAIVKLSFSSPVASMFDPPSAFSLVNTPVFAPVSVSVIVPTGRVVGASVISTTPSSAVTVNFPPKPPKILTQFSATVISSCAVIIICCR